jgi:hypothetical protein
MSIVGAGLSGVLEVGETPGLAVGDLIERVNPLDGVIGLNVKSGLQVVVALADEGVERDNEAFTLVLLRSVNSSLSSSSHSIEPNSGSPISSLSFVLRANPRLNRWLRTHSGTGTPAELKNAAKL